MFACCNAAVVLNREPGPQVADQLGRSPDGDHLALRASTVAFMQGHRADFEPFLEEDEEWGHYGERMSRVRGLGHKRAVTCLSWNRMAMGWCQRSGRAKSRPSARFSQGVGNKLLHLCKEVEAAWWVQEGTWAGQQELVALARDQRLRLRVYQAGQPSWVLAPDFPDFPKVWSRPAYGNPYC